ncbi:hypothetical protein EOD39_19710 [Acipenser ruthenus]|uniref:Uncharacterized protein n=1 Tax=Acipenser ruthenus TaxID=7906 RepID=A0A444UXE0_ACIRT|nr:hypothetical protein EOD39_19710 [Acipenser ruthenus]
MASADGFAAMFYGEPGVLGLLANGISAFLVLLQNFNGAQTGVPSQGVEHILAGVQLILIGGVTQLLAGLLSFRKYDHLSGTSFIAFAALWGSYGSTRIVLGAFPPSINSTNTTDQLYPVNSTFRNTELATPPIGQSAIAGLIAYISISFILSFCSATVNYIMPFVFGAITLTLIFEAVGLVGGWALVVSGVLELVILMCGLYGATALLLKVHPQVCREALEGYVLVLQQEAGILFHRGGQCLRQVVVVEGAKASAAWGRVQDQCAGLQALGCQQCRLQTKSGCVPNMKFVRQQSPHLLGMFWASLENLMSRP